MITILGLGPGDAALLTRAAWELIERAEVLYLRTAIHPTVAALPPTIELRAFDALYESAADFSAVYEQIAAELVERALAGEAVVYAVPGHPLVAEATTRRLLALARARSVDTRIVAGLSFVEPVCTAIEIDPLEHGLQLLDALDLTPSFAFKVLSSELSEPAATQNHALERSEGSKLNTQNSEPAATQNSKLNTQNSNGSWSELQGIGPYTPPLLPFPLAPTRPALICQLYSRSVASHAKLSLMERYPAEHPVTLVRAAGVAGAERVWTVPLRELDHQRDLDHLTCAYLPPLAPLADLRAPEGVIAVFARLLGPGGCPWDREQTHQSIRSSLLEEAYEVLEALDADDMEALAEELGDLLGHIVSHSEMGRQAGVFDLGDVCAGIVTKLIRRHPHVFGDLSVSGSSEVLRNWETIKQAERTEKGQARRGTLDGIPAGLPALATAQELARKAGKRGFEWPTLDDVWNKLDEELAELREAAAIDPSDADRGRRMEEELGDVLFVAANLARWLSVDAESALRTAGARFCRRFAYLERRAHEQSRDLPELSIDELLGLWREAKAVSEDRG